MASSKIHGLPTVFRWPVAANVGFVILARKGIFPTAGRICGENQLSEIAKRMQQGFRDIWSWSYSITSPTSLGALEKEG
jgi:hypothetical protein